MEREIKPITQAGYDDITAKIDQMTADKPAYISRLAAAAALGDRSENAEYSEAKRDLRHLESQIHFMTKELQYSKVVKPNDDDRIELGKTVTIEMLDDHEIETYPVVGEPEADLLAGKITTVSPLGAALVDHHEGDTVTVDAPNGPYQVTIKTVSLS